MNQSFLLGDQRSFSRVVTTADTAQFDSGQVHPVYSTFALARDAEWSGRLFVLEMKEDGEEGIGTGITVVHHAPALVGETVVFTATLLAINGNEVVTTYEAHAGNRLVASGEQRQKILKKEKLERLFARIADGY
jgi:predicted thioesterase